MKKHINIVWFKRDLRLTDHQPLLNAIKCSSQTLLIYIYEPMLFDSPKYDKRHFRFIQQSIKELNSRLYKFNTKIHQLWGDAEEIFTALIEKYEIDSVYSHQETGIKITFDRDIQLGKMFRSKGIKWHEYQNNGVIRALKDRTDWSEKWREFMSRKIELIVFTKDDFIDLDQDILKNFNFDIDYEIDKNFQIGGELKAHQILNDFLQNRSKNYRKSISKPEQSRTGCSRISPYLSWGNISMRQVYQAEEIQIKKGNKFNLANFRSRLYWHCHFIQKFELQPDIEYKNANSAYDSIRTEINPNLVKAWENGMTGIPIVDACMRCLDATGYINFRMRAMLVSFLTHNLWQPWQAGTKKLASVFLDYEPGIHYSQFQMQAGTWGTHTIRSYNPTKQAGEHDTNAEFIKKWVPELSQLPPSLAIEPWKVTGMDEIFYNFKLGMDYPEPVVDLEKSGKFARDTLHRIKNSPVAKRETNKILAFHKRLKG